MLRAVSLLPRPSCRSMRSIHGCYSWDSSWAFDALHECRASTTVIPDSFPAPVYADTVLAPNFEDAKKYFLDSLIEIHYAHTRMLAAQGIVTREDERALLGALDGLDREAIRATPYNGAHEDLFYYIESLLVKAAGRDIAGKMHTARSRNDISITLYRMAVRRELLKLSGAVAEARSVLLDLASRHLETVMPAHTHTQPAQP